MRLVNVNVTLAFITASNATEQEEDTDEKEQEVLEQEEKMEEVSEG